MKNKKKRERYKMSRDWSLLCLNVNTLKILKKWQGRKYRKVLPPLMWKLKKNIYVWCLVARLELICMMIEAKEQEVWTTTHTHTNNMHQRGNNLGCIYKGWLGLNV